MSANRILPGDYVAFVTADTVAYGQVVSVQGFTEVLVAHDNAQSYVPYNNCAWRPAPADEALRSWEPWLRKWGCA